MDIRSDKLENEYIKKQPVLKPRKHGNLLNNTHAGAHANENIDMYQESMSSASCSAGTESSYRMQHFQYQCQRFS